MFKNMYCIPLSVESIECTEMAITEFLLFVLTATLGGMFLCGANDLITHHDEVKANYCSILNISEDIKGRAATIKKESARFPSLIRRCRRK